MLLGATGFTGRFIADHFATKYGNGGEVRWAIAGRSLAKLAQVRDAVGASADLPLIQVDNTDLAAIQAMIARTRAVVTAAGPYQLYGSLLVQACAESGTDYLDLSGEPAWMRQMIDAYESTAKASGARILFSCGFDSIPSELGVWLCQDIAKATFGAPASQVKGCLTKFKGGVGGGSIASGAATRAAMAKNPGIGAVMMSPFGLTPGFEGAAQPAGLAPLNDPDFGQLVPFFLAMINTKNVHRGHLLMGHPFGKDFTYFEMMQQTPEAAGSFPDVATLSPDRMPKPGEGPAIEDCENGSWAMSFIAIGDKGRSVRVDVEGAGDPGFRSTSRMIAETALCLRDATDVAGGIWTPGAALNRRLLERLKTHASVTFRSAA